MHVRLSKLIDVLEFESFNWEQCIFYYNSLLLSWSFSWQVFGSEQINHFSVVFSHLLLAIFKLDLQAMLHRIWIIQYSPNCNILKSCDFLPLCCMISKESMWLCNVSSGQSVAAAASMLGNSAAVLLTPDLLPANSQQCNMEEEEENAYEYTDFGQEDAGTTQAGWDWKRSFS